MSDNYDAKSGKTRKDYHKWLGDSLPNYRAWQREYVKRTYASFTLRFRRDEDADLIDAFSRVESKNAYIALLVRNDLAGERLIDTVPQRTSGDNSTSGKVWVVDRPAYTQTVEYPELGHWEDRLSVYNKQLNTLSHKNWLESDVDDETAPVLAEDTSQK